MSQFDVNLNKSEQRVKEMVTRLRRGKNEIDFYRTVFCPIAKSCWGQCNLRWKISILDTIADYGYQEEAAFALTAVTWINALRISETMRSEVRLDIPPRDEIGGGLTTLGETRRMDALRNMARRLYDAAPDPQLRDWVLEVLRESLLVFPLAEAFSDDHPLDIPKQFNGGVRGENRSFASNE